MERRRGFKLRSEINNRQSTIHDSLRALGGFAVNLLGGGEIGMPERDAPATDWGGTRPATGRA